MKEGRKLKNVDPINSVGPYIMPTRAGASNYFTATLDIEKTEEYIKKKRSEGMKGLGMMHVVLAGYVRAIATHPGANRFIRGQKLYARNGIDMCITIKKSMKLDAPESCLKIPAHSDDTINEVYHSVNETVCANKGEESASDTDSAAKILKFIPGVLLKFIVWLLKLLDYFNLVPGFLIKLSPFHGSMYITNLGSLGINPVFHHLYDFGNLPLFCAIGGKRTEYRLDENGNTVKKRLLDMTVVCDERICDGHYYASAFKMWKKNIENPELLDAPPKRIVID